MIADIENVTFNQIRCSSVLYNERIDCELHLTIMLNREREGGRETV